MAGINKPGSPAQIANKILGAILLAMLCAFLVWLTTRSMTIVMRNGGLSVDGVMALMNKFGPAVAKRPFAIDWSFTEVKICAALSVGIPIAYTITYLSKGMKFKNEDTQEAHGNARFATKAEASELLDKKNFFNNFYYGEDCGMVVTPHDKKTKEAATGLNNNCITLGISGLGKTYNLVMYDLMQSVGTALDPEPYGVRNIPAHLKVSPAAKLVAFVPKAAGILMGKEEKSAPVEAEAEVWDADTEASAEEAEVVEPGDFMDDVLLDGSPVADVVEEVQGEVVEKVGEGQGQPREEKGTAEQEEGEQPGEETGRVKGDGTLARRISAVKAAYGQDVGKIRKEHKVAIGGGFDVVNTDPKGDNVRDVGWMYEAAGFDIKVVNTINFRDGLKVNPLAYIKTQFVDLVPADQVEVKLASQVVDANGVVEEIEIKEPLTKNYSASRRRKKHSIEGYLNLRTDTYSLADVPETDLSVEELDEKIQDPTLSKEERDIAIRQRSVVWMKTSMGSYMDGGGEDGNRLVEGRGCAKVASAVTNYEYRHTTGEIIVNYTWHPTGAPQVAKVLVDIPECLVIDNIAFTEGNAAYPQDEQGNAAPGPVVWDLSDVSHAVLDGEVVAEKLVISVHIKPFRVADGVQLTKTVDCLVANLKGTSAGENSSEDPFWEDTKRLCFMSLIAMLFERYEDEKYHTIPEMMKLLNMCMADGGDPAATSPMDVLMEQWERAEIYQSTDPKATQGVRGMQRGGQWVATNNDKHDRNHSMALHCYHAFKSGAPETVQSVIISCHAALSNLVSADAKEFLSKDELHLDTLGDPGQKQVIFLVTKDTDSPFDFITALITYLAIDLTQDKAYDKYGGKLPRHVRFILDEVANIGKIPILIRALAVVRSRNISISMFLQSKAQLAAVYGEKQADIVFDNCSTLIYLGAQSESTVEEMSKMLGEETVFSRTFQRNFGKEGALGGSNESLNSTGRRLRSGSDLRRLCKGTEIVFIFNHLPVLTKKNATYKHPLYSWIHPGKRSWLQPLSHADKRFDYLDYLRRHGMR